MEVSALILPSFFFEEEVEDVAESTISRIEYLRQRDGLVASSR
jgi:hypothetical protein